MVKIIISWDQSTIIRRLNQVSNKKRLKKLRVVSTYYFGEKRQRENKGLEGNHDSQRLELLLKIQGKGELL